MRYSENNLPKEGQSVFIAGPDLNPNKVVEATFTLKPVEERSADQIGTSHLSIYKVFNNESEAADYLIENSDD